MLSLKKKVDVNMTLFIRLLNITDGAAAMLILKKSV